MAIHFKSIEAEETEYQILHLNVITLYLVAMGYIKEMHVPADMYDQEGEVYLHQVVPETDSEESRRKKLYDDLAAIPESNVPPYEELVEFDNIIPLKAEYTMGVDENGESVMKFKEIIWLQLDEQLAYDAEGNLVLASELDEDDDTLTSEEHGED